MDIFTLIISIAIVGFFMFFTTLLLYKTSKSEAYLLDWSCAGLAFCLSNIISMTAKYNELPFFLHPTLANTCYVLGHFAILTGVIKLTMGSSHLHKLAYVAVFVVIIHYFDFTQSSVENRILTFYPIILSACLGTIFFAWKKRKSSIGRALWLLLLIESLFAIQLIFRTVYMLKDDSQLQLFGSDFMQTSGSLSLLIFLFLITLCFVLVVSWKKELRLREYSRTDYLTGWLNRRALVEIASSIFERSNREKNSFGVIIFDIDHFKKVNDTYGHAVGDNALKHICALAKETKRCYDFHFRLGGEEFAILVHNTDINDIKTVSERIRSSIDNSPLENEKNTIAITVSIGISLSAETDNNWEQALDRADKALYEAKAAGRNLVKVAQNSQVEAPI